MRRLLQVALLAIALTLVPVVAASAKKGENNAGGSDRSEEVRQNGENNGGGNDGGGSNGGTGTPDAGDNMHPSGNDKSVEPGGSYPQGHSESDPDGMSNGGADKPGGTGGIDLDDQDGNNGCGNDDDFEDDNNGNCGGLKKEQEEEATAAVVSSAVRPFGAVQTIVLTEPAFTMPRVEVQPAVEGVTTAAVEPVEVLSAVETNVASAVDHGTGGTGSGLLPSTGRAIDAMIVLAIVLLILGSVALGATRRFTPRSG